MSGIQMIKISNLMLSSLNPRQYFDEAGIGELAESIKQVGLLSPIIVRAMPLTKIDAFEVICGARRLKASLEAGLTEIPAIIRELTDTEALDLMITENLQRQDVSPVEEAIAFQGLIEQRGYDIPGLVARFGKSELFIRQRLKLNDLIPEFRILLDKEVIGIGHAQEISKLQAKDQKELFEENYTESDRGKSYWSVPTIKQLKNQIANRFTLKLEEAPFNTMDVTLDKSAGDCASCLKNSASNQLLFPDAPAAGICLDRACYKLKSDIHFTRELGRIREEEPDVIIAYPAYLYGSEEKEVRDLAKQIQAVELSYENNLMEISLYEEPKRPDREDYDDDEKFSDDMEEYEGELEDYRNEMKEYQHGVDTGKFQRAFMIAGRDKGKLIYITRRNESREAIDAIAGNNTEKEIEALREKDKRNLELSFEKTYEAAKALVDKSYTEITEDLTQVEYHALFAVIMDSVSSDLAKDLAYLIPDHKAIFKYDRIEPSERYNLAQKLTPELCNRILRSFIRNQGQTGSPGYDTHKSTSLIEIARERYHDALVKAELEAKEKYLKRKASIEKKIQELEAQHQEA